MAGKKIASIILTSSLLLSCTACSEMIESGRAKKEKQDGFVEVLEDYDFEEYKGSTKEFKHGIYQISSSPNDIKTATKNYDFGSPDKEGASRIVNILKTQKKGDKAGLMGFLIVFKDEDYAQDYFDEIVDFCEDIVDESNDYVNIIVESDIKGDHAYLVGYDGSVSIRVAAVIDDDCVYYIYALSDADDNTDYLDLADDICDDLGFKSPGDLL